MTGAVATFPAGKGAKLSHLTAKGLSPRHAPTAKPSRVQSRALRQRLRRQAFAATGIGLVATVLTGLSLSHLAHGIGPVTGCCGAEAWAFSVGVGVAMIAAELAMLFAATPGVWRQISTYAVPFIRGTLASSAVLNAFAFYEGAGAGCALKGAAIGFGLAIPAGIYPLTTIGAALYLNGDR